MKQSVNFSSFVDAFRRFDRYDAYGYDALKVIFEYLEEYEDSTGEEIELDVIAICCDYTVATWDQITCDYKFDIDSLEGLDEEEKEKAVIEWLNDNTIVLGQCRDGIVYQVF